MLLKRVIVCLDVRQGRVVKGVEFQHLREAGDAVEMARDYTEQGADELVFLDVEASPANRGPILSVIEATARQAFIPMTVGGGIREVSDARALLRAGADKVSIQTAAVLKPDLINRCAAAFGSQCVVVAIDARRRELGGWEVFTHGGRRPTGLDAVDWALQAERRGAGEIMLTSIDADGGRQGYDIELTAAVARSTGIPVIASGGAGHPRDLARVLTEGGADAALAASIFHSGTYPIPATKRYLALAGLAVRL